MSIKMEQFSTLMRGAYSAVPPVGREKIYYHLLRANLHEVLENIYPRVIEAIGTENWKALLDTFLHQHKATTPYFYQLPDEFLSFLWHNKARYEQWPWLWALAHFEWMELVATVADEPFPEPKAGVIRCTPVLYPCQYDYSVYPGDEAYAALTPRAQPWQGIVYRNRQHDVNWFALEPWPAGLLQAILHYEESSVKKLVAHFIQENNTYNESELREAIESWCELWRELDILI